METQTPAPLEPGGVDSRLSVVKVGGSLLIGEADLHRVASAVAERRRDGGSLLVVASALKGVTDLLERLAAQALDRRQHSGHLGRSLEELRLRHIEIAQAITDDSSVLERVRRTLDEVEELVASIRAAGELADAVHARLLSSGERLSVLLLAAAIRSAGQEAHRSAPRRPACGREGPPAPDLAMSRRARRACAGYGAICATGFWC